jgi:hypothetical protein
MYTNGQWQLSGVSAGPSDEIRGRGYVASGDHDGSGWTAEARAGAPYFLIQPIGETNNLVKPIVLYSLVSGTPPISYQWMKNGTAVTNYVFLSGANTPTLNLSVPSANRGDFTLVASNAFGYTTSQVATVIPIGPTIVGQPVSVTTNAGATVSFSASATGQAPLSYQWFKEGVPLSDGGNISGALSTTLTLSNVGAGAAGSYYMIASNSVSTAGSATVSLTVTGATNNPPTIVAGTAGWGPGGSGFGFDVAAEADQTVAVDTSTNLIDWVPLFTNIVISSPIHFNDANAVTNQTGFYRVRIQ